MFLSEKPPLKMCAFQNFCDFCLVPVVFFSRPGRTHRPHNALAFRSSDILREHISLAFSDFAFYKGFSDLVWVTSLAQNINLGRKQK